MKKKKKSYTLEFIPASPDPSGKTLEEIVVEFIYDFAFVKVIRDNNFKLTITKEEYIKKVITKEIGLYDFIFFLESLPDITKEELSVVDEIISLQTKNDSFVLSKAKERARILQSYIDIVESYRPYSFETEVIHEYAIHGNVVTVAEKLNDKGHRVENRSVRTGDVSSVLMKAPIDDLHRIVSSQFRKNKGLN